MDHNQIAVCAQSARQLEDLKVQIRKVQRTLELAGLDLLAVEVGGCAAHVDTTSCSLERQAKEAFAAVRRKELG